MKRVVIISAVIMGVTFVAAGVFCKFKMTDMSFVKSGKAIYHGPDNSVIHDLTQEELNKVKHIFNHHIMNNAEHDMPSCGFSEERAIMFNDSQTFCLACDDCDIIFWKERNVYFCISQLSFVFSPCISVSLPDFRRDSSHGMKYSL